MGNKKDKKTIRLESHDHTKRIRTYILNLTSIEQMPEAMNIATISAGFEKGDFLVREEQGNRVYFDFFEEVGLMLCC